MFNMLKSIVVIQIYNLTFSRIIIDQNFKKKKLWERTILVTTN